MIGKAGGREKKDAFAGKKQHKYNGRGVYQSRFLFFL
jgi:hypothetical protein